jgi:hypothetical protein
MRKVALTTLALATVVAAELAARILIDHRGFASLAAERSAFLARVPVHDAEDPGTGPQPTVLQRLGGAAFTLHPFFGYTFRPSFAGTNNLGFYSGGPAFPYHAAPDELVVGIFGGSVAMQVADARERIAAALAPIARVRGYDRVTVLSFAVGGWRQPQQFHALVRFIDDVDVAVVIDGFNEVIHLSDWHLARQAAEFPWSAVYQLLARQPTVQEELQRADLIRAHASAAAVTRQLDRPLLRSSALLQLAWRAYVAHYEATTAALRDSVTASSVDRDARTDLTPDEIAARRIAYLDWWGELLQFSREVSHARGRAFFHFVQPNQYDRGAKPLSAAERDSFTRNTSWFDEVTPRYAYVKQMTDRLRRGGIDTTFLGDLFATTRETVYADDCCHLNALGIAMLADAVASHIVASPEMDVVPPADVARAWREGARHSQDDSSGHASGAG